MIIVLFHGEASFRQEGDEVVAKTRVSRRCMGLQRSFCRRLRHAHQHRYACAHAPWSDQGFDSNAISRADGQHADHGHHKQWSDGASGRCTPSVSQTRCTWCRTSNSRRGTMLHPGQAYGAAGRNEGRHGKLKQLTRFTLYSAA
jgi:hypothetical protein